MPNYIGLAEAIQNVLKVFPGTVVGWKPGDDSDWPTPIKKKRRKKK